MSRERHPSDPEAGDLPVAQLVDLLVARLGLVSRQAVSVDRARIAGRSALYFVTVSEPTHPARLVVKVPRTGWQQDDLASPVSAAQEHAALERLHRHLAGGSAGSAPVPVTLIPEIDALAMEWVPGRTIRQLLTYQSLRRPRALLDGLSAAGRLLRAVHGLESHGEVDVDLGVEGRAVIARAEELLTPRGLALPTTVRRALSALSGVVTAPQVLLHGDFGPGNVLLSPDGPVILDPALDRVGHPADDLVRFVALMSGSVRFAADVALPPARALRRRLETRLLEGYADPAVTDTAVFHLRALDQLTSRWGRQRELAAASTRGRALPTRLAVVDAQLRLLLREHARALTRRAP